LCASCCGAGVRYWHIAAFAAPQTFVGYWGNNVNPVRRSVVRQSVVRRSRYDPGPRFAIGLDLGQARDYTAVVIVERALDPAPIDQRPNLQQVEYHVRHIERFALGTRYPNIVESISELLSDPQLAGQSRLIVDGTGVGAPVVDMFLHRDPEPRLKERQQREPG
jgi:hypothetical protein